MPALKPPPPPTGAPPAGVPASSESKQTRTFRPRSGVVVSPQKIGVYGTGGIGKSSLIPLLKDVGKRPLVLDLDDGSKELDVDRLTAADGVDSWESMLDALKSDELWKPYDVVCIDTCTKAEEYASQWVIEHVPHEKGHFVSRIEDYGFGKGYTHIYEVFLKLLAELDRHIIAGRDVLIVMHVCTSEAPNPSGDDFLRYEPRLQNPGKKGQSSVRDRVKEWCDHLLFIGYDVDAKDGKGRGVGMRTIYPQERPTHVAKSRLLSKPIPYLKGDATIWKQLFNKQ